jgi:hypothetical protein
MKPGRYYLFTTLSSFIARSREVNVGRGVSGDISVDYYEKQDYQASHEDLLEKFVDVSKDGETVDITLSPRRRLKLIGESGAAGIFGCARGEANHSADRPIRAGSPDRAPASLHRPAIRCKLCASVFPGTGPLAIEGGSASISQGSDCVNRDIRHYPPVCHHGTPSVRTLAAKSPLAPRIRAPSPVRLCGWLPAALLLGICLSLPVRAGDGGDKVATEIADSWLGHDASELLTQWPVDKGYRTYELDSSNETAYSFNFGIDAYSYSHDVYDGQQMVGPGIIQQNYHEEVVNVPRQDHCFITFYANAEGIIARYEYSGIKCRPYLKSWGRPKGKS